MDGTRAWRKDCAHQPPRHRHCVHGHLSDCPKPWACPLLSAEQEPRTVAVTAGRVVWLYDATDGARAAQVHADMLTKAGAHVEVSDWMSEAELRKYLQNLPEHTGWVQDWRTRAARIALLGP